MEGVLAQMHEDPSQDILDCPAVVGGNILRYLNMLMLYLSPEACDDEHGTGSFTAMDGSEYVGDYEQDTVRSKPHGFGRASFSNGDQFEGEWRDGRPHGFGALINVDGSRYEGEFWDGRMHGQGIRTLNNGECYEGSWCFGMPHGFGKLKYTTGCEFEGEWEDGNTHGRGVYRWPNGDRYEGEWRDNKPSGHGVWYSHLKACEVEWQGENGLGSVTYAFNNNYTWWVGNQQEDTLIQAPQSTATMVASDIKAKDACRSFADSATLDNATLDQACGDNLYSSLEIYLAAIENTEQTTIDASPKAPTRGELQSRSILTASAKDALYFLLYTRPQAPREW